MSPDEYLKAKVTSPLSERALRSRVRLLTLGVTATVMVHTNLVPTQIEGLGIAFSKSDQQNLVFLLLILLAYCLVSFAVTTLTDLHAARWKQQAHVEQELDREDIIKSSKNWPELSAKLTDIVYPLEADKSLVHRLRDYRLSIDIIVPLIVGLYGTGALVWYLYSDA